MTPTRRSLTTLGAATLLATLALTGCAEEEPTQEPSTSSSPEDEAATSAPQDADEAEQTEPPEDAAVTSAPADDAEETEPPEDAAVTSAPEPEAEEVVLTSLDDTFEVSLPEGWEDVTDTVEEESVLVAARQTERLDDFYTNVVVTQEEYVGNLTSAVENTAEQLAGEDGEYEILEPAEVDGHLAPGYTLTREVQDLTVQQTQRWISRDGTLHVVTFSAVQSQAEDVAPVLDELLASWTWTD
ncbi:hypothetical protein ACI3EY_12220 [Ornithinimicrobium sp. LYQ92]|uniref:hypothetical protein n=1 Tax=Serinicoccus sp. LYQ92 TaxID=3378798 RepID=UPI0038547385